VRVPTDGQTHAQTQTDFIICPMLYAIAMGQIIIRIGNMLAYSLLPVGQMSEYSRHGVSRSLLASGNWRTTDTEKDKRLLG